MADQNAKVQMDSPSTKIAEQRRGALRKNFLAKYLLIHSAMPTGREKGRIRFATVGYFFIF